MMKYLKPMNEMPMKSGAQSFPLHHAEHEGLNPMFQSHVAKTFQVHPAKISAPNAGHVAPSAPVGSPWTQMMGGKAK